MSKGPKISIITACYNAEKTIEQTILSVINQTYDNIEYIIVDGASNDGTMSIVNKYKDKIDIIISEPDNGIYDAFNKGAKVATGDYVQYLNADDYLYDSLVIKEISVFIQNFKKAKAVYGGILKRNPITDYVEVNNQKISIEDIQNGKMIPHPATFISREILNEFGYFDESYKIAADYDLISKLFKKYDGEIFHINRLVSIFRTDGISNDLSNRLKIDNEVKEIIKNHFTISLKTTRNMSNEFYLKKWIEKMVFENSNIGNYLSNQNIFSVAIWGSGEISNIIAIELNKKNIKVESFLDNNIQKNNLIMNNIQINNPDWLLENTSKVQAIIFGFEGDHEIAVRNQLERMKLDNILVFSWKELVSIL